MPVDDLQPEKKRAPKEENGILKPGASFLKVSCS
jgi:hypothetical protein